MEKINTYSKLLARKFRIKLVRYQITTFKLSFGPTGLLLVGFLLILWARRLATFVSHLLWDRTDSVAK